MSALSLHLSPSGVARRSVARRARRRSWFARFMAAVHESRMRTAREVIAQHRHLLPADFERAANRLDARSEDRLPFMRRD